jgi:CMP-N-acetylneuraminic acid synthetase
MSSSLETIVALLPMRDHSERVPGKNYRELGGVPLFHHVLGALSNCPSLSRIVIDTDSDRIRDDVRSKFPKVELIDRPVELCGDDVPMTDILHYDATKVQANCYLQTHSTNPFLRSETIEAAIACWHHAQPGYDSLFSVTRLQARLWDHTYRPMNHDPKALRRTQDLEPVYVENSNLYIFPGELIAASGRRIGDSPKLFEIDPLEALDIDDEQEFALAERLMKSRQN